MDFWKTRSFLFGAAYYCIVSLAIILFSSPLFRVLGFEYSGFIALFASIHLLYYASGIAAERKSDGIWNIIKSVWFPILFLSSIPLVISIISVLFIPNCSLWDGIVFYIEIVYPTALIAMLCGIRFGIIPRSKTKTNIYLAIFWIATMILSLLPGYFSAKIYTYGWQYGFFPGFVWDEAMELSSGYWISRILEFMLIIGWILYDTRFQKKKILQKWMYSAIVLCIVLSQIFFWDIPLHDNLRQTMAINSHMALYFSSGSLTKDEIQYISFVAKKYAKEIDSSYSLKNESEINIYIFPSSDDLYQFIGTREASISKPWRHAIYITKQNLHSLKHEMAHIILTQFGSFPFNISWSTGLTEGAAVAIEGDYDGIRSVDEYSARMLQMNLTNGVEQVMKPMGFLSSAPSQSYVLAGSFSKYLIQTYGTEKFLRVYRERDFDAVYNKQLPALDKEWQKLLHAGFTTPMEHYDSLRTMYYFGRTSILRQPCIRQIGKLLKQADIAYKSGQFKLADSVYSVVITESGRLTAIRGRVLSQLHLNNPLAALAILDTTASANEIKNNAALHLLRGDVIILATGDLKKASDEWEEAIKLELGSSYFMSAFMHRYFFGGAKNVEAVQNALRDIYSIDAAKDKYNLLYSIEPTDSNSFAFTLSRLYMYSSYVGRTGELSKAYSIWKNGREKMANISSDTSVIGLHLFEKLVEQKYFYYEEIFKGAFQPAARIFSP